MKDCTERKQITVVLNKFTINDIGNSSHFCKRERATKPFKLVMLLITALGDKSVDTLTETDVFYKPFNKQLSKPEFVTFIKQSFGVAMVKLQLQALGTTHNLSGFKKSLFKTVALFLHMTVCKMNLGTFY